MLLTLLIVCVHLEPSFITESMIFTTNWCSECGQIGTAKFEVEKFTGSNDFGLWRVKVRTLLVH